MGGIQPVTRRFDVFFDVCLNKRLSKQSGRRWFETPSPSLWRHFNGLQWIHIPCTLLGCVVFCCGCNISSHSIHTQAAPLQWHHNDCDGVSNHQPDDCLLNRLFGCRSKEASKLRVTGLCEGNSSVTGESPAHRASNAENVFIWWRHHAKTSLSQQNNCLCT